MDKSNNFEFMSNIPKDVLELTKEICPHKPVCNDVCNPLPDCVAMLYAWRTINAGYAKVVRCRDCKSMGLHKCRRDNLWHDDDDFCSRGEPKMKGGTE